MNKKYVYIIRFLVASGILALSGLSYWSIAQADGTSISMCVKKSGASYVIGTGFQDQSCKNNEQLISFNVQGPAGPQGPVGPQGPEGASVKLYDANNEIIGYILDTRNNQNSLTIFDKLSKVFINLNMDLSTFEAWPDNQPERTTYYTSTDCTGQGYLVTNELNSVPLSDYAASYSSTPAGKFLFTTDKSSKVTLTVHSLYGDSCGQVDQNLEVSKAINIQSTLDAYARPFHIGL